MDWEKKCIEEKFGGDEERFKVAYEAAIQDSSKDALSWDDLKLAAITFPELEAEAHDIIERRLGYLPHPTARIEFEPFIRALIQVHRQKQINDEDFEFQIDEQVKLIRNQDLNLNTCLAYDKEIYENYSENYHHYRNEVKERLTGFLGYEPLLEHSLIAEMWMQNQMADDTFQFPEEITTLDLKAITLIKYREVLLEFGLEEANNSRLWGIEPAIE
jgi:hypothetical protein